ncbi:hypothetical protein SAMN04488528_101148 [Clostridium frigidicarnis]|uniref:ABC-2 type transport system permease protein n=2 Tax=Clostridium frigidicarnis TaxID=84698 RepID=A0A1I0Y5B2_9CLOT|nr:hypothetical protein SAMN04488528_101148 [Clostridium frigidicarnis]
MTKPFMICKMIFKIWQRNIKKILNTKSKVLGASLFIVFTLLLSVVAGYIIVNPVVSTFINGDNRSMYLLLAGTLVNVSIMTTSLFVLVKSVTQEQGEFIMQLNWFPLTTFERNLGYKMPIFLVILSIEFFLNILLLIPSFVMNGLNGGLLLVIMLTFIIQAIFIFFLNSIIYDFGIFIISKIGLAYRKVITLSILLIAVFYYFIETFSVDRILSSYTKFDYNLLYLGNGILMKVLNNTLFDDVSYVRVVGCILGVTIVAVGTLFLNEKVQENNSSKILRFLPMSKGFNISLMIKEVKVQLRNEENFTNILLFLFLAIAARLKLQDLESNAIVIGLVSLVCSTVALNSFGNENNYFKMYKATGAQLLRVLLLKELALFIIAYSLFLIIIALILGISISLNIILISMPIVFTSIMILYILGILIPVDKKNPYMGILAFVVLFLTMIPAAIILSQAITTTLSFIIMFALIIIVLFYNFYLVAKWRINYE